MKHIYIIFILLTFFLETSLFPNVINVPADQVNIQGGINAAVNGDTVLVQPGTYVENINFNGKNIVVGSLTLTTGDTSFISETVIHGDTLNSWLFSGNVVNFSNGEDSTTVLCGFTIRNGYVIGDGGGIHVSGSSPHLSHLLVKNNTARFTGVWYFGGNGGGICLEGSNAILENVSVKNNLAIGWDGSGGGGISIGNSSPILVNVKVIGNTHGTRGGGIYCSESNPKLSNVTVTENFVRYSEGGGIVFEGNCLPIFDPVNRCNIYFNEAQIGQDLYTHGSYQITAIVDTFTVMQPDDYFAYPSNNFQFDILNAKVEQANSDLYVSFWR